MTAQPPAGLAGRYELGPLLGAGGMADVYRARDVVLDRPVAVKVFRLDVEGAELARVEQEMRTLGRLTHPGLVVVYDAGGFAAPGERPRPYLVMELVQGSTWEQEMDRALPGPAVVARGAELADTLAYVHGQGVVHRDVKPANILLTAGGRTKLADFGVALVADSARHTRTGLTIGTAPYLSPEQVLGEPIGPPTDVYALGLVLLEALTGRREYPGTGTESALARLHRQPAVPSSAPAALRDALTAMTARQAQDRPTAGEVHQMLRRSPDITAVLPPAAQPSTRVLTQALPPAAAPVVSGPGRNRGRSRRLVAAGAAVGLLALGVLAVSLQAPGGDEPGPSPAPASRLERDLAELREAVTP